MTVTRSSIVLTALLQQLYGAATAIIAQIGVFITLNKPNKIVLMD